MFKRWRKKLLKSPLVIDMACVLIAAYIRLVYVSGRKTMAVADGAEPYVRGERPAIFVFWHGRLLLMPMVNPRTRPACVLISHHADGELIARAMRSFGIGTIRGSSSRGGASAATEALSALERGDNLIITPDGPRGPARLMQPGAVRIAAQSGVPVVPVSYSASRGKRMKSWDRFFIPYPFAQIRFMVGAPVMVTKESVEEAGVQLQAWLVEAE